MSKRYITFRSLTDTLRSARRNLPRRDGRGSARDSESRSTKPLDRSIRWMPIGYVDHPNGPEQPFDLFVDHSVLHDVMAHLLESSTEGSFGLLSGTRQACSSSELPYIRVRKAYPAAHPLPDGAEMKPFRQHLEKVRAQALGDEEVVGWYHAHGRLGITLTARDARLHTAHFDQPWHCALVVVPDRQQPRGGFFSRLRGDGAFRHSTVPFFEVAPAAGFGDRPTPSHIGWPNYEADRPFTRIVPDQPSSARPAATQEADETLQPDEGELGADQPVALDLIPADAAEEKTDNRVAVEPGTEPVAEPAAEPAVAEEPQPVTEPAAEPAVAEEPEPVPEPAAEPAIAEGPEPVTERAAPEEPDLPVLEPFLKKRLEELRRTSPLLRDHGGEHPVAGEVSDQDALADEAAGREFLWHRWSRRVARTDRTP